MMHPKAVALIIGTICSSVLLSSPAAAIDAERQPIYSNTPNGLLCGTHTPPFSPSPCTVPTGQRLIIEHVSGYSFLPASTATNVAVDLVVNDPELGLNGGAFHTFVATKTNTSGGTDVFAFTTPFRMMLHPGATFYFAPTASAAVSGYLVKE